MREFKGVCDDCGELLADLEDADYCTSWIQFDDGSECCGDCFCGYDGEVDGTLYGVTGSMGIEDEGIRLLNLMIE